MRFSEIQARLDKIATFVIGSPFKPPLNRREFIRASLFVFLVRFPIMLVLSLVVLALGPSHAHNILSPMYGFFVALPVLGIFFAQYLFVFYRRLKGIGFKFPGILTWSFVIIAFIILILTPDDYDFKFTISSQVIEIICFLTPYLLLLPWKDKPNIES